ncbi:MAG: penicillin-binding protein activator [Sphingomonadales bacterium]
MVRGLHSWLAAGKVRPMSIRLILAAKQRRNPFGRCLTLLVAAAISACAQPQSAPRVKAPPIEAAPIDMVGSGSVADDIRIAAVLPLSGPQARLGDAMAKAVEMAFFQAADPRLKLRFFDSAGSAATPDTHLALKDDILAFAPAAVVGPLFSSNAQILAAALLDQSVPVLTFSNDMTANAAGAILLGQQPEQEITRVLAHAAPQLETRRLGMILPSDIYGDRVATAVEATVQALNFVEQQDYQERYAAWEERRRNDEFAFDDPLLDDAATEGKMPSPQREGLDPTDFPFDPLLDARLVGSPYLWLATNVDPAPTLELFQMTQSARYERNLRTLDEPTRSVAQFDRRTAEVEAERLFLTDLDDPMGLDYLDSIRNLDTFAQPAYDALILAEGGQILRALAPLLNVYEIDEEEVQFIGTGLWNDPGLSREPALHGGLFAAAPPSMGAAFTELYEDSHGTPPPPLAAIAYDAMALIALAGRDEAGDPAPFDPARLFKAGGFVGATGLLRILPSGIAERMLAIMKITESGLIVVEDAPSAFPPDLQDPTDPPVPEPLGR